MLHVNSPIACLLDGDLDAARGAQQSLSVSIGKCDTASEICRRHGNDQRFEAETTQHIAGRKETPLARVVMLGKAIRKKICETQSQGRQHALYLAAAEAVN
jgi:hypothetical protein